MDYTDPNNLQVTFTAGSVQGSSRCVSVSIINDNFLETNVENFFASLTAPGSNAVIVAGRSMATVNIVDNNDNSKKSKLKLK